MSSLFLHIQYLRIRSMVFKLSSGHIFTRCPDYFLLSVETTVQINNFEFFHFAVVLEFPVRVELTFSIMHLSLRRRGQYGNIKTWRASPPGLITEIKFFFLWSYQVQIWDDHRGLEDNPVMVNVRRGWLNLLRKIGHVIRQAEIMLFILG